MNRVGHSLLISVIAAFLVGSALIPAPGFATPDYARQTGLECRHCHVDAIGGGTLTDKGKQFLEELKSRGQYRSLSLFQHVVRLVIGYLHMLAAIIWFGTIMYVHVLLKPAYASKGLPKGELRLGWIAMIVLLITGLPLTIARIPSWSMFYTTRFGILLGIKIFLYLIMVASAVIVTVYIGPRLKQKKTSKLSMESESLTLEGLSQFDGKEGRPAHIAYKGIIYDVTKGKLWKNGSHAMKHGAGNDLTENLKNAPHGEDKVLAMPQVGKLTTSAAPVERPFHERLFYFFAYMNLVFVFVITFVIALWRWW